jgi:hypothetical protein
MQVEQATLNEIKDARTLISLQRQAELAVPGKTNLWTDNERELIKRVWKTLDPKHCMYDAAWLIAKHGRER